MIRLVIVRSFACAQDDSEKWRSTSGRRAAARAESAVPCACARGAAQAKQTSVRRQLWILGELAQFALRHGGLDELAPAQVVATGDVLARFADCHFGDG